MAIANVEAAAGFFLVLNSPLGPVMAVVPAPVDDS